MEIRFHIGLEIQKDDPDLTYIDEDRLRANLDHYRPMIMQQYDIGYERGLLKIVVDDEQYTAIDNEMKYSADGLCYTAAEKLLNDTIYIFHYFDMPSTLQLLPADGEVFISGDYIRSMIAPLPELVRLLVDCGDRYMAFLEMLDPHEYRFVLRELQKNSLRAHQAIEKAGI